MSASQVTVIVLIVAAFALGWWGHGWRQGARSTSLADAAEPEPATVEPGHPEPPRLAGTAELDATLQSTITAFQATLGCGRPSAPRPPWPARRSLRSSVTGRPCGRGGAGLDSGASPDARAALDSARRAADRLSEGLAPLAAGEPLDLARERSLLGAERALTAARHALLAASASSS